MFSDGGPWIRNGDVCTVFGYIDNAVAAVLLVRQRTDVPGKLFHYDITLKSNQ